MNIRKYYLITRVTIQDNNPGDVLIGNGIEALLNEAEIKQGNIAIFRYVDIFGVREEQWEEIYREADYLILCGTPQLGEEREERFLAIWPKIKEAKERGIITANLWCGVGAKGQVYDIDTIAEERYQTHKEDLENYFPFFDLVIVRDEIIKRTLDNANIENNKFIDSVFYASNFWKQEKNKSLINIITLRRTGDQDNLVAERAKKIKFDNNKPTIYIVHNIKGYIAYKDYFNTDELFCVDTAKGLQKIYSYADQVISMRIHGSVSALSFGASVCNICIDARSNILETVGVGSIPFDSFLHDGVIKYETIKEKINQLKKNEANRFIKLWEEKCQSKYNKREETK